MKEHGFFTTLLASMLAILTIFGLLAYEGLAVMLSWRWFIEPLGVVGINLWHGAGISVFIAMLVYQVRIPDPEDGLKALGQSLKITTLCIIIGYSLHWFI